MPASSTKIEYSEKAAVLTATSIGCCEYDQVWAGVLLAVIDPNQVFYPARALAWFCLPRVRAPVHETPYPWQKACISKILKYSDRAPAKFDR
jgi:hypothetical protein